MSVHYFTRRYNSLKDVDTVTVLVFCTSSGNFHESTFYVFKVMKQIYLNTKKHKGALLRKKVGKVMVLNNAKLSQKVSELFRGHDQNLQKGINP